MLKIILHHKTAPKPLRHARLLPTIMVGEIMLAMSPSTTMILGMMAGAGTAAGAAGVGTLGTDPVGAGVGILGTDPDGAGVAVGITTLPTMEDVVTRFTEILQR